MWNQLYALVFGKPLSRGEFIKNFRKGIPDDPHQHLAYRLGYSDGYLAGQKHEQVMNETSAAMERMAKTLDNWEPGT